VNAKKSNWLLVVGSLIPLMSSAQHAELAVNHVVVNDRLHTAGQPPSEQLSSLADRGFEMVVNLAPPTSQGAIANEGQLVAANGITYVNIPVDWLNPTYADFALFSGVMNESDGRQVLVHCQVNKRASIFTFLYRVVHMGTPVEEALEAMEQVWVPEEQWVPFGKMVFDRNNIDSDIFD
jgi:protein tyrosine phosphatase (PTP) superfamily phosphohydrolase (DUF442 family)